MPFERLFRSLVASLLRLAVLGLIVGGVWLLLQHYSEEEIVAVSQEFWAWWSTLFTGQLAPFWNPVGAAGSLILAAIFVLSPLMRWLNGGRRSGGHHYYDDHHSYDSYDGGGDSDGDD